MKKSFILLCCFAILATFSTTRSNAQSVFLDAGSASGTGGYTGDGTGLTSWELDSLRGLCFDHSGSMFIADYKNQRIRKISGTTISTIAGSGSVGFGGDGGQATAVTCKMNGPTDVVTDGSGNVYFSDYSNNRVRKINVSTGIITTVVGNGTAGYGGDGGAATAATCEINQPVGIVFDHKGNLYIADQMNHRIRKVTPGGIISTFAGTGVLGYSGDGGPATAAQMRYPLFMRFDMWGNLLYMERETNKIRMISPSGIITSVAGVGTTGFAGDGSPATTAQFSFIPGGIRFDGAGNLYVADADNYNVRKITAVDGHIAPTDLITSIAGTHTAGFSGDGGPATAATFRTLSDILVDTTGNIFVSDGGNNVVRFIDVRNQRPHFTGGPLQYLSVCENSTLNSINSLLPVFDSNVGQTVTWNLFAGPNHGSAIAHYATPTIGSGTPVLTPTGLSYTPATGYYGNDTFVVWVNDGMSMDTTEVVVTVNPLPLLGPISGPTIVCAGNTISLNEDSTGGSWSSSNTGIATVNSSGVVTGVGAGTAIISYSKTNSCGTSNALYTVREGNPIINLFAGNGTASSGGDGGAATAAGINYPTTIYIDASGNKYITEYTGNRLREISSTGVVSTVTGNGTFSSTGDGGLATAATTNRPAGVCKDAAGNIYIAEQAGCRVRKINTAGIITTVVGDGSCVSSGDGGPASAGNVGQVTGVAVDGAGNLYIAEYNNARVRMINTSGIITTFAGGGGSLGDGGPASAAQLNAPYGLSYDGVNSLFISDEFAYRVRQVNLNTNIITTFAGNGTTGFTADGAAATAAALAPLGDVYADAINVYIGEGNNKRLRIVNRGTGIISTVAGSGSGTYSGDGGPATAAGSGSVSGVALDAAGNIYITDIGNNRIRVINQVDPAPVVPITGPSTVCVGSTIALTETATGGTWTSSNIAVGTVDPSGNVTGISPGVTTITYSIIYSCGTLTASWPVTVNTAVAAISPVSATICTGSSVTFADATLGGTWALTNGHATNVGGVVTGATVGLDTVVYTLAGCSATAPVTVVAAPASISPSTATICTGQTVTLTDATGGGVWSASNGSASVTAGTVSGVVAGIDTISYSIGSCVSKAYVTVNASPAAVSPASATICVGSTTNLTDATSGGTWSASNGDATVVAGLVTGISAGTDIISYTKAGCSSTAAITVVNAPAAIAPSSATVCVGSTVTLLDGTSGGTWSATNAHASVASGLVTGISVGIDTIVYSVGSCFVNAVVTVNGVPAAITPAGSVTICAGSASTLSDGTPGGTWSSGSPTIASVSTGGVVTGVLAGTANISYTTGAGCSAIKPVTVVAAPSAISPAAAVVCVGATTNLTESTGGGTWSATNGNATVAGGTVTGLVAGVDTIIYTIGSCTTSAVVTVNGVPAAITPAGAVSMCVGASAFLSDASPGGSWSSGAPGTATVSGSGLVTGVTAGVVNISYTNGSGCAAVKSVTINITPSALTPASATLCIGNTVTLTDGVGGGAWSSSAPGVATVTGGVVTGVAVGSATITFTIGTCTSTATVTVGAAPAAGSITGPSTVCVGSSVTLTDPATGGVWSSATPGVASVSGTGSVLGISGGIATISYTVTNGCGALAATATVNVVAAGIAPITGLSSICAGTFTTLADATTGGSWSASNTHATITGTGLLTGVSAGTDTITYTVVNVCGTSSTTKIITVGAYLTAGTITGGSSVCAGANITLADLAPGGVWGATNGNAAVSGGVVTGVVAGVDTITYTVTAGCGSAVATHSVTVNPLPSAGTITGPASVCIGSLVPYTDAVGGGVWSMTNAHATITLSGVVSPLVVGIDTILYTVTTTCGTATTNKIINVGPLLSAGAISGPAMVCTGSPVSLTDGAPGGVWSASNGHATISGSGLVTGITSGIDTIYYTVTGSCGTAVAVQLETVNLSPAAGAITGPSAICLGSPVTYTDAAPGGVWSMSNTHAAVSGTGLVTPVSIGTDTISYTVSNVCGSVTATQVVTIGGTVTAGTISGPGTVCLGTPVTLTDATPGGIWSASNGHATVAGGVVTGVTPGTDTILYTVTASCGTAVATTVITVSPVPAGGSITGPSAICAGTFSIYTETSPGGVWTISNGLATISAGGLVTALTVGADTITYTITNSCGTASATKAITIGTAPTAGTISGPTALCTGSSITLIDGTPGGTWGSSNTSASVGITGIVSGLSAGIDTISYSVTNSCGTVAATYPVTVSAFTATGAISGPSAVCFSASVTLADGVAGGVWSATNANATVSPAGLVNGVTPGLDTIVYTVTGVCGAAATSYIISVDNTPVPGTISGPGSECVGASMTLTDGAPGGIWSAVNPSATVGSATGIVTGITAGTDLISYTVGNACGTLAATMLVTINPLPAPGIISGPDSVCIGSSVTVADAAPGGAWSASNANATISGAGVITGVTAGNDTIAYTVTNGCGTAAAIANIAIVPLASAAPISGISEVCAGSGITLSDATAGGTWVSSNAHAMVTGPGIIIGVTPGVDTILYLVTNPCGTSTAFKIITVNPVPVVAPVSGPTSQCTGTNITMTDATAGGVWTSSAPAIATVGLSSGIVSGIATGMATITYTVTNMFGCPGTVTAMDTVSPSAVLPAISGSGAVCVGASTALTDAVSGGTWSSAAPGTATVASGTGVVSGVSAGTVTISYMVSGSCGTAVVTTIETVNPLPVVAAIGGLAQECPGTTSALTDATTGGTWSSANPAVATVGSGTGIVTGIGSGSTTISYLVTSVFGCTSSVSILNTVNAAPVVSAITGTAHQCTGSSTVLADATVGGTWTSSNASIASVSGTGLVTGVAAGVVNITYTVSGTGCAGFSVAADTVFVVPVPSPVTGATHVCTGSAVTLADAVPGGTWSSGNTAVATIGTSGIVSGVAAGTDEIYYSVSNSCGSVLDSVSITVQVSPVAGTISGASSVCQGATITLTDAAGGGTWTAANGHASVGLTSGVVTGVSSGSDTVKYTVTNACGSAVATRVISVGTAPYAGTILGAASVCEGMSLSLSETITGGTWSTSNTAIATVSGGTVTGVSAGIATISYTVANTCGSRSATAPVTVVPADQCNTMVGAAGMMAGVISVYPNPAANMLKVDAPVPVSTTIYSVDGRQVTGLKSGADVDISGLANGMYFINIYDAKGQLLRTAKFAKAE